MLPAATPALPTPLPPGAMPGGFLQNGRLDVGFRRMPRTMPVLLRCLAGRDPGRSLCGLCCVLLPTFLPAVLIIALRRCMPARTFAVMAGGRPACIRAVGTRLPRRRQLTYSPGSIAAPSPATPPLLPPADEMVNDATLSLITLGRVRRLLASCCGAVYRFVFCALRLALTLRSPAHAARACCC